MLFFNYFQYCLWTSFARCRMWGGASFTLPTFIFYPPYLRSPSLQLCHTCVLASNQRTNPIPHPRIYVRLHHFCHHHLPRQPRHGQSITTLGERSFTITILIRLRRCSFVIIDSWLKHYQHLHQTFQFNWFWGKFNMLSQLQLLQILFLSPTRFVVRLRTCCLHLPHRPRRGRMTYESWGGESRQMSLTFTTSTISTFITSCRSSPLWRTYISWLRHRCPFTLSIPSGTSLRGGCPQSLP